MEPQTDVNSIIITQEFKALCVQFRPFVQEGTRENEMRAAVTHFAGVASTRRWSPGDIVRALNATHPYLTLDPTPLTQARLQRYNVIGYMMDEYTMASTAHGGA